MIHKICKVRNIPFHLLILFFISCIQRECGETNSIYVDLQMARDTFEKLTKKDWISFLVITNTHLKNRAIRFLYRNHHDCSFILSGAERDGIVSGEEASVMRLL